MPNIHVGRTKKITGEGKPITRSEPTWQEALLEGITQAATTNATAAEKANAISAEAQQNAMDFNERMAKWQTQQNWAMMNAANAFSAQAAEKANDFTQTMWNNTANFNATQQQLAQEYNSAEAERQRQWAENMSNTSYQRAVADLKAAGLNPVLAAMNGGASTPSGSSGSIGGTSIGSASGAMANAHQGSAGNASVGSYTGILENTSNELALMGAMVTGISTALEASGALQENKNYLKDAYNKSGLKTVVDYASGGYKKDLTDAIDGWKKLFKTLNNVIFSKNVRH